MLTQVEWTTLKFVLKVICNSHATPFDWDSNGSVLLPTKSKFKICMSFLILLTVVTYGAFDMARLPETYHRPGGNGGDVVMHSILCLWYVNVALWQLIVSFGCRQEFAALFNQQVNFNFCKGTTQMSWYWSKRLWVTDYCTNYRSRAYEFWISATKKTGNLLSRGPTE